MKKAKKNLKKQNKLIPFVILAIFLAVVLYLAQNAKQQPLSISDSPKQQVQEPNQQVLDCAKKLDQDQLALGKQASDCLFLGCGGVFQ